MRCEWCEVNSGRTSATRPCCILRRLANAPAAIRREKYDDVLRNEGKEAANSLILAVNAERQRLRELNKSVVTG